MKILSFIPWASDRSANISSCLLDSETGRTFFETARLIEYKRDEIGLFVPKKSALCASLHNRIQAESPDEIVTYFELGLWRSGSKNASLYPSRENGTAILKQNISSTTELIKFVGKSAKVLEHEKIAELFGWEEARRTFDNFSVHFEDEDVWQRFCFSLCMASLAYDQHQKEVAEVLIAANREKNAAEEKAIENRREEEEKVAEAKKAATLEKIQSFDL